MLSVIRNTNYYLREGAPGETVYIRPQLSDQCSGGKAKFHCLGLQTVRAYF